MRGNASRRPDFQRTKQSHQTEMAMFLANATDSVFAAITLDLLERRHGGKGGLSRKEIEYALTIARQSRERRAAGVVA